MDVIIGKKHPAPAPLPPAPSECDADPYAAVLPCSTSLGGSLVLLALWSYILCKSGMLIQYAGRSWFRGSSIGKNVVLPILESVPNAVVVMLAGLMTTPDSREHIAVGVGTMAGSSVILLTTCWGAAVLAGRTELSLDGMMIPKLLREPFDLLQTGVSTDATAPKTASIMLASAALYLIIEIPSMINIHHLRWLLAVTSLLCMIAFVAYCSHQALAPIAARKADVECRLRHLRYNTVRSISYYANRYGGILLPGGQELNVPAMERTFQRFDRDRDNRLSREELCMLLAAFEFCRPPPPALNVPSSASPHTAPHSHSGSPPILQNGNAGHSRGASLTEQPSSPEFEQLRAKLVEKAEGHEQQLQQQQAEQQRNQFHARYGHVEHVAEHLLRQWGGLRTGGVTVEGFITHLKEWFAEKEQRFVIDFPTAKPPKAIRRAGATKFWLLTYKAPDDYQELLLQHKAKRDAAAASAAAATASKGAGGKRSSPVLIPSGIRELVHKWKSHSGREREGLAEPLIGSAQRDEEQGFSFDGDRHLDRSTSGPVPIPAEPPAGAAPHQSLTIAPDPAPHDLPSPSDQASQLSAAGGGVTAAGPAPDSPLQHFPSQELDGRSSASLPNLVDGSVSPTHPHGSLASTLPQYPLHQAHTAARSSALQTRLCRSTSTTQHSPDVEGDSSPSSSMAEAENLLSQLEDQLTVGQSVGRVAATWEAIRCWGCGLLGFLLCVAFAGPFIRTTGYASSAMGVHPFLVAFLVGPLASHVPNIISSVRLASSKQPRNVSIALGQVYGSVTMINTLVLGVLLGVMASQHIRWKYTGELIIALVPTLLVGSVGASSRSISTIWGLVLLSVYPVVIFLCWLVRSKLK